MRASSLTLSLVSVLAATARCAKRGSARRRRESVVDQPMNLGMRLAIARMIVKFRSDGRVRSRQTKSCGEAKCRRRVRG